MNFASPNNYRRRTDGESIVSGGSASPSGTQPTGVQKEFSYDIDGRLVQVTTSSGDRKDLTYDQNGNVIQVVSESATTDLEYDLTGNLIGLTRS
jgi:YD repeat-containing protein